MNFRAAKRKLQPDDGVIEDANQTNENDVIHTKAIDLTNDQSDGDKTGEDLNNETDQKQTVEEKTSEAEKLNDKNQPNEQVAGVTSEYSCKQFYESPYDQASDDACFEKIDLQAVELCRQFNDNQFKFVVKDMKEKHMRTFIDKLKSVKFFMIYFELQSTPGLTKRSKPTTDLKVRPGFLKNVINMCILIDGDNKIYSFKSNTMVCAFKYEIDSHGFEFENKSVSAICFDIKLAFKILKCCFELDDQVMGNITWHDPKVAHWLLNPDANEPKCLLDILPFYLKIDDVTKFTKDIDEMSVKNSDYNALFSSILLSPIMSELKKRLIEMKLYDSYINVELPVILIFGNMELTGISVDILYLKKSSKDWSDLIAKLKADVQRLNSGEDVNPRSPQQVHKFLAKHGLYEQYVKLVGLPEGVSIDSLKTGREVLEKMVSFSHLPGLVLDQRVLLHLIDTAKTIEKELRGRSSVMGLYKHYISTGRVSMHDPNLLGIDKEHSLNIGGNKQELCIKKAFVGKAGYVLIGADYSQLELRILAALSQEENLTSIFENEKDPFKMIAAKIKNKDVDQVEQSERDSTKQIIYAIIYGMGLKSLSFNLGVESEEVAAKFLQEFYQTFPKLESFIERCKADAKINGYIQTLFGRRRLLPDINSEEDGARMGDERKSVNSTIQGSAADLVKLTMLKINQAIQEQKFDAEFLLQIHDELIFQIRDDQTSIDKFTEMLKCEMTSCGSVLHTKFSIKVKKGRNWGEMNEILVST